MRELMTPPGCPDRQPYAGHSGAVSEFHGRIGKSAAHAVDHEVRADAVPGNREHILTVDVMTRAHTQFAENAAVKVDQQVGMTCVNGTARVKLFEEHVLHVHLVGRCL